MSGPPTSLNALQQGEQSAARAMVFQALATAYERIVAPANQARAQFNQSLGQLGPNPSRQQVAQLAAGVVAALDGQDAQLQKTNWVAPSIKADITALVAADRFLENDLSKIASDPAVSFAGWQKQASADNQQVTQAIERTRKDLGLPPS